MDENLAVTLGMARAARDRLKQTIFIYSPTELRQIELSCFLYYFSVVTRILPWWSRGNVLASRSEVRGFKPG